MPWESRAGKAAPRCSPYSWIAGLVCREAIHNFDDEIRGMHLEDLPGAQMIVINGIFRNDASIENVAAYVETLEPGGSPMTIGRGDNARVEPTERPFNWDSEYAFLNAPVPGDPTAGEAMYASTCVICHAANGTGNEVFGSPDLTVLAPWYMERQLEYFQDGIRGADPQDVFGSQMVIFAKLLANDQAIADVVAYIETL